MDLRQVEYAVAVIDNDGFTRAAQHVHVSQPSLSAGVASLERELGAPLFERLPRRVILTAAGHAFEGPARQLLRDARTIRAAVQSVSELDSGQLDIVALPTLAVDPLAPLIGGFRLAHPNVTVRLIEPEDADAVVAMVRDGRCELGLAELPAPDDVVAIEFLVQEVVAVSPPGTRLPRRRMRVDRLAGVDLIATPPGTSTRRLLDQALAEAGVEPRVAVETGQREAIVPLVLAGAGTSFLPAPQAEQARIAGAVVARLDPPLWRRIGVVHRPGPLSPAAAAFIAQTGATASKG
jgi:LysR family transcriptional regulator, carnitine catabolism transcriptional activator